MDLNLKSYSGHSDAITIISPGVPSKIFIDGKQSSDKPEIKNDGGVKIISFSFRFERPEAKIRMEFK